MRILIVEDDRIVAQRLTARLSAAGFVAEHAGTGEAALDWADPDRFDAMIVDLGLPGLGGIELIRTWRARGIETPILILSARGAWQEKVDGLNAGADDYVVKPARGEEIVARIHALARRSGGRAQTSFAAGDVTLDPTSREVRLRGEVLDVTQIEYRLLQLFLARPGHILSQTEIMEHLYPMNRERDLNTIEVHVGRLRRKIGRHAITTVRGLGYRFER